MKKTQKDLKRLVPNYNKFIELISKNKKIIHTGRLSEFYCEKLLGLTLSDKCNALIDAKSKTGKKIEIKQRNFKKTPPGMPMDLEIIDYVLYVELDDNLLPKQIFKIMTKDIERKKGIRVSFKKAWRGKKYEIVFES